MSFLFISGWMPEALSNAIGWTIVHSLWQGLLAAGVAGLIILFTRYSTARLRFNLLGLVIIAFLLTTVITFFQLYSDTATQGGMTLLTDPSSFSTGESIPIAEREVANGLLPLVTSFLQQNIQLIVGGWFFLFLFHCIKLTTGLAGIHRIRYYHKKLADAGWQLKISELGKLLKLRKQVFLVESGKVNVPVAIGFLKPVILVPAGLLTMLPPDQVETILLHELAHIRRNDYVMNILLRFSEAVFFFNPGLRWISSLLQQEREACCDDLVLAHSHNKGSYLKALVSFQENGFHSSSYAMAIGTKQHYLLNRVRRLITRENKKLNIMEKLALISGLTIFTAFSFIPLQEEKMEVKSAPVGKVSTPAEGNVPNELVHPPAKISYLKLRTEPGTTAMLLNDTVPAADQQQKWKKQRFASVSRSTDVNGEKEQETITATEQNGKKYVLKKDKGVVSDFSIDGKSVPAGEIEKYNSVIHSMEGSVKKDHATADKLKDKELKIQKKFEKKKLVVDKEQRVWKKKMKEENKRKQDGMEKRAEGKERKMERRAENIDRDKERAERRENPEAKENRSEWKERKMERKAENIERDKERAERRENPEAKETRSEGKERKIERKAENIDRTKQSGERPEKAEAERKIRYQQKMKERKPIITDSVRSNVHKLYQLKYHSNQNLQRKMLVNKNEIRVSSDSRYKVAPVNQQSNETGPADKIKPASAPDLILNEEARKK